MIFNLKDWRENISVKILSVECGGITYCSLFCWRSIHPPHAHSLCSVSQITRSPSLDTLLRLQDLTRWIPKQGQPNFSLMFLWLLIPPKVQLHSTLYTHLGHHTTILQVRKQFEGNGNGMWSFVSGTSLRHRPCPEDRGVNKAHPSAEKKSDSDSDRIYVVPNLVPDIFS